MIVEMVKIMFARLENTCSADADDDCMMLLSIYVRWPQSVVKKIRYVLEQRDGIYNTYMYA